MGQKKKSSAKKSSGQGSTQTGSSQSAPQKPVAQEPAAQTNGSPDSPKAESREESPVMNGHDESGTSSSTDTSPGKPLTTPKGLPSLNGKHSDSSAKAKADSRSGTPKQAQNDALKALEGTVNDLRGDLRAEQSRREEAEAYLNLYKLTSLGLGFTTAACATLAIVSMLRCK